MKIYLCSFADSFLTPSIKRYKQQAEDLNYFEDIFIYNEHAFDGNFKEIFHDKLNHNTRGFGYWIWKPYIILKLLEKIDYDDILVYTDIGCHINKNGLDRLNEYIEIVKKHDFLGYKLRIKDRKYTKSDLFSYFNVLNNKDITNTDTVCATNFILKKTDKNINLIRQWLDVFYKNFSLVDDSVSKIKNFDDFIEHRHDQSIFSILVKMNNLYSDYMLEEEIEPIQHRRDLTNSYSFIINKITWFIPISKLRYKVKSKLINYSKKIFYSKNKK